MKNKFCILILFSMLALPVFSLPEGTEEAAVNQENEISVMQNEDTQTAQGEEALSPAQDLQAEPVTPYKEPISKRKIAKKFILAMLGVVISSFAIYLILSIYNKIREGFEGGASVQKQEEDKQLAAPNDLTDALKSFIEKTKWD